MHAWVACAQKNMALLEGSMLALDPAHAPRGDEPSPLTMHDAKVAQEVSGRAGRKPWPKPRGASSLHRGYRYRRDSPFFLRPFIVALATASA